MIELPTITSCPKAFKGVADAFNRAMKLLTPAANIQSQDGSVTVTRADNNLDLSVSGGGGGDGSSFAPQFLPTLNSDGTLSIAAGEVRDGRTYLTVAATAAAAAGTSGQSFAWAEIDWSTTAYTISTATINFGSAWPPSEFDATNGKTYVPLAAIVSGTLNIIHTGPIVLHLALTTTNGVVFTPAAL